MKIDYKEIGNKIKARREELNIKQEDLAKEIGVNKSYISDIETATKKIGLETLINVANKLNISMDYLTLKDIKNEKIKSEALIKTLIEILNTLPNKIRESFLKHVINSAKFIKTEETEQ